MADTKYAVFTLTDSPTIYDPDGYDGIYIEQMEIKRFRRWPWWRWKTIKMVWQAAWKTIRQRRRRPTFFDASQKGKTSNY